MRRWWTAEESAVRDGRRAARAAVLGVPAAARPPRGRHGYADREVADLAGLTAAFDAYRASLGAQATRTRTTCDEQDREFFLAFAQAFGAKINEAALRAQLANDHTPETFRMDTVRNLDAWYEAFDVVPGQRLYLEPRARVHVW